MIGDYTHPKVRLPGSGGATEIATCCRRTYIVMKQSRRTFVDKLDFLTSLGHGPTGTERAQLGVRTEGPVLLVSDLCVMKPHRDTHEFEVVSLHPGVSREQVQTETGWPVRFAADVTETPPPSSLELDTLRDLHARTARAHGSSAGDF